MIKCRTELAKTDQGSFGRLLCVVFPPSFLHLITKGANSRPDYSRQPHNKKPWPPLDYRLQLPPPLTRMFCRKPRPGLRKRQSPHTSRVASCQSTHSLPLPFLALPSHLRRGNDGDVTAPTEDQLTRRTAFNQRIQFPILLN
jgi:hypothetical protein